jgi:hypothetical protein
MVSGWGGDMIGASNEYFGADDDLGDDDLGDDDLGEDLGEDAILGAIDELGAQALRMSAAQLKAYARRMQRRRGRRNLPRNPTLAREVLRSRERVLTDARRMADTGTQIGIQQAFNAAQTTTVTITPADPFTPQTMMVDPSIAQFFNILTAFVGSKSLLGSTQPVRCSFYANAYPVQVRWPGFSPSQPLIMQVQNVDTVNARTFIATLSGIGHQSPA